MPRTHRLFWPGLASVCLTLLVFGLAAEEFYGCASNPVIAAQDTEQRAYAIYGTFVIVEEQAAKLIGSPGVSGAVAGAIRQADARAKPSADALAQAVRDYEAAAQAFKTGGNSGDKLAIATANLQKWIGQAQADVSALVSAVKQGS